MNSWKRSVVVSLLMMVFGLLPGCGPAAPTAHPTYTSYPTYTPLIVGTPLEEPTETPVPASPTPMEPSPTPIPPSPTPVPPTPTPTPTPLPLPRLRVVGNQIQNEGGDEVILRGLSTVSIWPAYWGGGGNSFVGPWKEDTFRVISEWGANVVRIPIMPNAWRELGSAEALRRLDQSVGWAGKNGLYVIVDLHSIGFPPGDYYRDEANATSASEIRTFWHLISSQYANNNVVAFYELHNEPSAGGIWEKTETERLSDWLVWKEYVEELIDHIRVNDPDKIVIVGGLSWCQDLAFVVQAPIERENVAYAAHPYPATPDWETNIGNVKTHFPVIATEFGFNNDDEDFWMTEAAYEGQGRYREAVINYLEAHRISWVAWCFSNHWGPRLLQSVEFEPTEPGEFFREQLQNLNR